MLRNVGIENLFANNEIFSDAAQRLWFNAQIGGNILLWDTLYYFRGILRSFRYFVSADSVCVSIIFC